MTVRLPLTKTGRKIVKEMTSGKHPKKKLNGQLVIEDKRQAEEADLRARGATAARQLTCTGNQPRRTEED